ncbi:probable LINE-1 retrotransposable element ORF2 protein [Coccomyxa sp. Obi]|nr:probable LINE-1 retrotransposable element ORF2 protein [Coccomyxa sp. Obi]
MLRRLSSLGYPRPGGSVVRPATLEVYPGAREGCAEAISPRRPFPVGIAPDSPPVLLDTPVGRNQGSTLLRDFYSGDSATGLFAARPVSQPAQAELLEALDKSLTPEAAATAEGGDGSIPITELEAALRSMPRGKAPGLDGIPYEFYQRFWPLVGGGCLHQPSQLTAVLQDAFTSPASPALPPSMLQGRIILLYKGKGADRASPASYRPITLLNTDYKLAARTVASRLGPVLNQVVDPTQTGFLPKRWVGDNVLAHLEEISYLEDTQQPGVIVFLDFEKAFDRLDRAWIEQCMAAVGFGAGAQRWVRILHTGTTARVAFNGWHTDAFPGRIILLYKGKGADRASPASYRPITLLNTDYKLAARTVASRLGPVLNQVVDPTQTGFLPKRWVGDNVLAHLEEISYLQDTQQPGVIVFLDFEKAFDRLDRAWIEQCMAAVGFGAGAQRWVRILHTGTTARVAFNGWHTDAFPVSSGVFQGSPLSPLLFVLATQPMAAHARRRAQQQAFQPIRLPSGDPAPIMHQHADDTSVQHDA